VETNLLSAGAGLGTVNSVMRSNMPSPSNHGAIAWRKGGVSRRI
jgi:hypothetical protein